MTKVEEMLQIIEFWGRLQQYLHQLVLKQSAPVKEISVESYYKHLHIPMATKPQE